MKMVLFCVVLLIDMLTTSLARPGVPTSSPMTTTFSSTIGNQLDSLLKSSKTEMSSDGLQILDQLIVDDALLASYSPGPGDSGAPTTSEDLLPGGQLDLEVTGFGFNVEQLGTKADAELLQVRQRLQKLDFYFEFLRVLSEDCRQRMLCEVLREPGRFYPLSSVLEDATSFTGSYQYLTSQLVNTTEGARLLSYLEASFRGQDRTRSCAVFQYRCPSRTEEMINYEALCLWREMVRWLTIHVIARVR